ncbi:hypothetical protein OSTOST_13769 [Ostertagia ostertagi]
MLIVMTYNTWLNPVKFRDPAGETADSFATDACIKDPFENHIGNNGKPAISVNYPAVA